ncbi:ADP-ribosylglycohydrolase family protein [uncultured Alistipes sp.]|mgnify:FL=1|uniref:ADP-ribosylglycohydrolase family protein n=1 Tax=uncultured Alistipes sp. TaxID=538949 RepID=UPI0025ECC9F0|nr:ADP-ribosylglycohydrolase family protein [uncultured Alistipes sp.]
MNRLNDRIYGILFGQAIGDALGLAAEGMSCDRVATTYPNGVNGYADIIQDDFRKRWAPGEWTDDTNQMLCILDSLLERRTVDPNDIAARFVRWFHHDGRGIGRHTYNILRMPQYAQRPYEISEFFWKFSRCNSAPNGALMRTCITGIWDYRDEAAVYENTENICRLTHFDPRCVGLCVIIAHIIRSELLGQTVTESDLLALGARYAPEIEEFVRLGFQPDIAELCLDDPDTRGYTLRTLAAGLWAYNFGTDFRSTIQTLITAGGDVDTNCAVAGALLGVRMGYAALPEDWVHGLLRYDELAEKARQLTAILY